MALIIFYFFCPVHTRLVDCQRMLETSVMKISVDDCLMMADHGRSSAGIWATLLDSLTAKAICMASGLRIKRLVPRTKVVSDGRQILMLYSQY